MAITPGYTLQQIRDLVMEYQRQRHGQKGVWLDEHDVSRDQIRRWRAAVFDGDLDRGLIPRKGGPVKIPPRYRTSMALLQEAQQEAHVAEVARLQQRITQLEASNEALGKAIGLLHALNEHEPDNTPTTGAPSAFFKPTPPSSTT